MPNEKDCDSKNSNMSEFTIRQELVIVQRMNDSKAEEIRRLNKLLLEWQQYLRDMLELWRDK